MATKKVTFKVGDIVVGKKNNGYGVTKGGWKGVVRAVHKSREEIVVQNPSPSASYKQEFIVRPNAFNLYKGKIKVKATKKVAPKKAVKKAVVKPKVKALSNYAGYAVRRIGPNISFGCGAVTISKIDLRTFVDHRDSITEKDIAIVTKYGLNRNIMVNLDTLTEAQFKEFTELKKIQTNPAIQALFRLRLGANGYRDIYQIFRIPKSDLLGILGNK